MIWLANGEASCTISPEGAWVESLTSQSQPILFTKSELPNEKGELKTRGGMHVCLPNFGPSKDDSLAQHGFGRTSLWTVLQQKDSSVSLELASAKNGYEGLVAILEYSLEQESLTARLSLTNEGDSPLRVAPGFHPYFALDASETLVTINGATYGLGNIGGTEYIIADKVNLITANLHVAINQENLTTWAIWTDQLDSYVCVEPTFGGNRFLETEKSDERLTPGETKEYSTTIRW